MARVEKELGTIDILVNNANIDFPMQPFAELSWADIQAKLTGEIGAMAICRRNQENFPQCSFCQ